MGDRTPRRQRAVVSILIAVVASSAIPGAAAAAQTEVENSSKTVRVVVPDARDQLDDTKYREYEGRDAPLQAPGLPDADEGAHQESEVEAGRMHDQSFEDVLMTSQMRPPHAARLVQARIRPLEQFAAATQEALASCAAHPLTIGVHRRLRIRGLHPVSPPALRFRNVRPDLQSSLWCIAPNGDIRWRRLSDDIGLPATSAGA